MLCPQKELTLAQLAQTPLRRPDDAGGLWQGRPHAEVVNLILQLAGQRGWRPQPDSLRLALSRDGADMAGSVTLAGLPPLVSPSATPALAWTFSNARRQRPHIYAGLLWTPRACGLALARLPLGGRLTRGLDLPAALGEALDEARPALAGLPATVKRLQGLALSADAAQWRLSEAGRRWLPWSRVGLADREYWHPCSFCGTGTAWDLAMALAYAVKRSPPLEQPDQLVALFELVGGA